MQKITRKILQNLSHHAALIWRKKYLQLRYPLQCPCTNSLLTYRASSWLRAVHLLLNSAHCLFFELNKSASVTMTNIESCIRSNLFSQLAIKTKLNITHTSHYRILRIYLLLSLPESNTRFCLRFFAQRGKRTVISTYYQLKAIFITDPYPFYAVRKNSKPAVF